LKIPVKTAGKWEGGGGEDHRGETPVKCWENILNNLDEIKEKSTAQNKTEKSTKTSKYFHTNRRRRNVL
jgi:hypothetical protein